MKPKKKKEPRGKKQKIPTNIDELELALLPGKLVADIGEVVVLRYDHRNDSSRTEKHLCRVDRLDADGTVWLRNLTVESWFLCNINQQLPNLRRLFIKKDVPSPTELEDKNDLWNAEDFTVKTNEYESSPSIVIHKIVLLV